MSEADLFEALASWASNGVASFTVFISFTTAFLTACYFVGKQLTNTQAIVLGVLYVVSAGSAAMSNLTSFEAMKILMENQPSDLDESVFFNMELWMILGATVTVSVMMASLYYLYKVKTEEA